MRTFEGILQKALQFNPNLNPERITQAFKYAEKAHEGQYRISGDPYISHLLAVLDILLPLRPDEDTIIACLLHGLPNSLPTYRKEIKDFFGENVLFLLNALESLYKVKSRDENAEAENIRKLFVVMAQDIRVILIKMADRLHNMETLSYRTLKKQKEIAKETLDVYVPISARLSIYSLKAKLEDCAFQYLYPQQYKHLKSELDEYLKEREDTIEDSIRELKVFLQSQHIKEGAGAVVEGRVKNLFSIYRKMKTKNRSNLSDLYDVYAIRIILPNKFDSRKRPLNDHLYGVLGRIHSKWKPLGHRFKDYVAVSKPNGYRSLHTAVIGLSAQSSQPTEIQIRTQKMHEEAEYGIASHWLYDQSKKRSKKGDVIQDTQLEWVRALTSLQKGDAEEEEFIDQLKLDVFNDRIFVMTPTGEVKDLPKGSTPVDFAYSIHSDIGHRCQLAKVNEMVVPLDYELKNGEVVEIVLGNKANPKPIWLSFVRTSGAKTKIRSFLRSLDKESSFRNGKERLNKELAKLGRPLLDDNLSILRHYNGRRLPLRERENLIEEIGNGSVLAATVAKKLFRSQQVRRPGPLSRAKEDSFPVQEESSAAGSQIWVAGESGLPYRLANCCKPRPNLSIVAYATRDHSLTIHLQACKLLRDVRAERILEASWGEKTAVNSYSVKIRLRAKDRVGLIRDIADVITSMHVNIHFFADLEKDGEEVTRVVIVEVSGDQQLQQIVDRLERIRNVLEVKRADD